ncbi:MAG: hypothetical protein JO122_14710 [Acetobacteraceae bacterium]|nr:hypothetical protein [Acetobacteraceae bacterium]
MTSPDDSIRQIEALIAELNLCGDPSERQLARSLLQVVLDLHGLALAQMTAKLAAEADGPERLARLAADPHVRAVLLLHGLHPEDTVERVARAVAALNQELDADGAVARLVSASATKARLFVRRGTAEPTVLRDKIEAAVLEAAPELAELIIDGLKFAEQEVVAG